MAKVHKPIGSKDRLYEMMSRVNKSEINENFDNPEEKDRKYLTKVGDEGSYDHQADNYDGNTRYPTEDKLKVDDPSLSEDEQLDEISWSGIKQVGKDIGGAITTAVSDKVKQASDFVTKSYAKGQRNRAVSKLEKLADKFGQDFAEILNQINNHAETMGDEPFSARALAQSVSNAIVRNTKQGSSGVSLSKYRGNQVESEDRSADSLLYPENHWTEDYQVKNFESFGFNPSDSASEFGEVGADSHEQQQSVMNHMNKVDNLEFDYDEKGNWIPRGLEDKRVALRKVEQPMGSGNEKFMVVTLDANGDMDDVVATKDTWVEAKSALLDGIS